MESRSWLRLANFFIFSKLSTSRSQFGPNFKFRSRQLLLSTKIKNLARRSRVKFFIFFQIIHLQITICGPNFKFRSRQLLLSTKIENCLLTCFRKVDFPDSPAPSNNSFTCGSKPLVFKFRLYLGEVH